MYFIKIFTHLMSLLILIHAIEASECRDGCIQDIKSKTVELQKKVQHIFESFKQNCTKTGNRISEDPIDASNAQGTSTSTNPPTDNSRFPTFVRYLTQIKRPVQDVGRPIHKPPDLKKIQSIVDQIKNVDFFNLDDDEPTTADGVKVIDEAVISPVFVNELGSRPSRNVFDDFSKKMKNIFGSSKKTNRPFKTKRNSNSLFNNIKIIKEIPTSQPDDEHHESDNIDQMQEPEVLQPTEDEKLLGDLNTFQSKLNPEQQLDISDFLDHVRDKPKAFKFDTSPYLLTQLEKLTRPITSDQQETPKEDEDLLGARKFFDFNSSPVKRSLYSNQINDYQKIAKLKSKLVAEYRDHHPMIDYSAILRRIDADKNQRAEKTDDFLDRYYQLNDGSSRLDDVMKTYRSDKHVISPFELNLDFQLDNQFKELDTSDIFKDQVKSADVPLHKLEVYENDEGNDVSP